MENKFDQYQHILLAFANENRKRSIPEDRISAPVIDLSENDYLGLNKDSSLMIKNFLNSHSGPEISFSSSASRLLAANQNPYSLLESRLEELYGRPALLFNSGYHANTGCLSALNIPGTIFLCDKLIHASAIDGISMSKAQKARWRHNDVEHLRNLLDKYGGDYERVIVVAESIYSMDGDLAPLRELIALKKQYPSIILYLDEAHAFGVRGERGLGLAEELGCIDEVDILVGTFGKAAASSGAFIITTPFLKSYMLNCARSFIFSTALPPVNITWTLKMVERIIKMKSEREYLKEISKDFRNFISEITFEKNPSESQIIPLLIGDAGKALKVAELLKEKGVIALPIRRPTVPPGGERLRFSLNAALSVKELDFIKGCINEVLNSSSET